MKLTQFVQIAADDISIDGNLDERAWTEVPWTEDFVDIR